MNRSRPVPVTLVSILFMVSGTVGIIYHISELVDPSAWPDAGWVFLLRVIAIVAGVFCWRGANWSRWVMIAWIAYHLVISFYHDTGQVIMHGVITALVTIALFYPGSSVYFKGVRP